MIPRTILLLATLTLIGCATPKAPREKPALQGQAEASTHALRSSILDSRIDSQDVGATIREIEVITRTMTDPETPRLRTMLAAATLKIDALTAKLLGAEEQVKVVDANWAAYSKDAENRVGEAWRTAAKEKKRADDAEEIAAKRQRHIIKLQVYAGLAIGLAGGIIGLKFFGPWGLLGGLLGGLAFLL